MKNLFFLILIGFLGACASTQDRLSRVSIGMSPSEVRDAVGEPRDRTAKGKRENWVYDLSQAGKVKLVVFENGKVVELLNADQTSPVLHEADKSGADAKDGGADHCVEGNRWGRFAQGGGCNMYGCWPASGYCNQWGCSSTGRCTVSGCPNKISSFKCKD